MHDERCECCDLPAYSCGRVKEEQLLREDKQLRGRLLHSERGWFPSMWGGKCTRCRERFPPGTPIRYDEVLGGYIAYCCASPGEDDGCN